MTALPVTTNGGLTYNSRGPVGVQGDITTQYLLMEQMLHELIGDLLFYEEQYFETVDIPEKMNEVVHWEINERQAGNAVWQITEHGYKEVNVFNSKGVAQGATANVDVPSQVIGQSFVEAKPLRYASIAYYTTIAKSVSKRDPIPRLEAEMGKVISEQLDSLAKGAFDVFAQDIFPSAADTVDNDVGATDYFGYSQVIKLELYVRKQKLNPPTGKRFPFIIPHDAQAGLLLDTVTRSVLEATAQRGSPMATIFQEDYIGSLRCFDFFASNRLVPTTNATAVGVNRGYIFTREAIGSLAMQSDAYGQRAKAALNTGPEAGMRAWKEEMPRPLSIFHHEPGSGALGPDPFRNRGALAETHTLGLASLRPGFLIRVMFATSPASDIGIGRAGTAGAVLHTANSGVGYQVP